MSGESTAVQLDISRWTNRNNKKKSKVIVELGVGYYAERTPKQAQGYYQRKVTFVDKKIGELQKQIDDANNSLEQINGVMRDKVNEQIKMQEKMKQNAILGTQNDAQTSQALQSAVGATSIGF